MVEPAASISALMVSWFTPSSLFIFLNLVIGTIAITSRFGAPRRQIHEPQLPPHDSPPQLVRSPSLLERVRSFGLGQYNHYESAVAETQYTQPQLVRTPSLLERVKSFNFGLYKHEPTHAETEYAQPHQPESENPCPNPDNPQELQLARTPSLLQRLQSMNFLHLYRSASIHGAKEPEPEPEPETEGPDSKQGRDSKMKKLASERAGSTKWECEEDEGRVERRRPATARSETTSLREEEEGVDARADDFINRFKKQLRLQRVDSILRYREMLRGN